MVAPVTRTGKGNCWWTVIDFFSAIPRPNRFSAASSAISIPPPCAAPRQAQDNKEFVPLAVSALARSRADWLYGINMTGPIPCLAARGCSELLSVGQVQTPCSVWVVRRDLGSGLRSKPFTGDGPSVDQGNERFTTRWHCHRRHVCPGRMGRTGCSAGRWPPRWWGGSGGNPRPGGKRWAGASRRPLPYSLSSLQDRRSQSALAWMPSGCWISARASTGGTSSSPIPDPTAAHHRASTSTGPARCRRPSPARPLRCRGGRRWSGWQDPQQGVERQQPVDATTPSFPPREGGLRADGAEALRPDCPPVSAAVLPAVQVQRQQGVAASPEGCSRTKARRIKAGWRRCSGGRG